MSGINGDKARFHRQRKEKIQRRVRQQQLSASLPKQPAAKMKEKSA